MPPFCSLLCSKSNFRCIMGPSSEMRVFVRPPPHTIPVRGRVLLPVEIRNAGNWNFNSIVVRTGNIENIGWVRLVGSL
ncbi:hypothetical protein Trydic_g2551 [Trypoxylus dichotomus]